MNIGPGPIIIVVFSGWLFLINPLTNREVGFMICEKCNKEITEGNFIKVPCFRHTNLGIVPSVIFVVCCDDCATKIQAKVCGSVRVVEAEVVKES